MSTVYAPAVCAEPTHEELAIRRALRPSPLPAIDSRDGAHPPISFERQRLAAWLAADQLRTWEHWRVAHLFVVELVTDIGLPTEDRTTGKGQTLDAAIADALRIYGFARGEMP